jgi:cold shock CspA family protein
MPEGVVTLFTSRGWGFAKPDDPIPGLGGRDLILHPEHLERCGIVDGLKQGDRISFTVGEKPGSGGRIEARNVRRVP